MRIAEYNNNLIKYFKVQLLSDDFNTHVNHFVNIMVYGRAVLTEGRCRRSLQSRRSSSRLTNEPIPSGYDNNNDTTLLITYAAWEIPQIGLFIELYMI